MIQVKRALISVSDKKGIVSFAKGLCSLGIEIISTGGTAAQLKLHGIPVKDVSDWTGFPEMLDGRVKTLHPKIHAGLLALRSKAEHMDDLARHKIGLIDMVVVNLYPFGKVISKSNVSFNEAIENIDIGGPSMLRSAAKNFHSVAVICRPERYDEVLSELQRNGSILPDSLLFYLAVEAFRHTAEYDRMIYEFLAGRLSGKVIDEVSLPSSIVMRLSKLQDLRYGENPHQKAAFYKESDARIGFSNIKQLHGKELSFNNYLDMNAAVEFVSLFKEPAAVIIKHNNPTGLAEADTLINAYRQAYKCDPISSFGGIIGLNRKVNIDVARAILSSGFMECVVAPGFYKQAVKILSVKKNLRLVEFDFAGAAEDNSFDFKKIIGGVLVQEKDNRELSVDALKIVTKKKPTPAQIESMLFGYKAIKHVRSNAILLVKKKRLVGVGCGQTSRVESVRIAIAKAGRDAKGSILISDGFFPKTDNITLAADAGIKAIIQPGGSIADEDVIAEADKMNIAMVFSGVRHFKH